jgi:hypothetical protein
MNGMEDIFNYFIKNFNEIYRINPGEFKISYGIDNESIVQIARNDNDYFNRTEPLNISDIAWKEWRDTSIPFLFDYIDKENIITKSIDKVIINYDIIAAGFYLLSNWQEYVCGSKDMYGRFLFTESVQHQLKITEIPVVNYYFDILKNAIEIGYKIKLNNKLWDGKNLSVCITHDIDLCESAWLQGSYRELRKGHIFSPVKLIARKIFGTDEWFNFRKIIEIENSYKCNSTFFFLPEDRTRNGIPNADYKITDPKFNKIFDLIEGNGSEVAVHGSIGTHNAGAHLRTEIAKTGREISGNRFHFLMYDAFYSPEVLSSSGLKYDSTLGFAEAVGFRNSICHPFYLYDIKNKRITDVVEIPLTVMDVTFEKKYMKMEKEEAYKKMVALLEETEKFNGCFTLLWHNTYFSEYKFTGWKEIYCRFLEYAGGKKALITSGKNILRNFLNV